MGPREATEVAEAPIFLIGMGRSGSTLLFECLAAHPDLGWLAHHANRFPSRFELYALNRLCDLSFGFRKSVERSDQQRSLLEKFRLGPSEAYETWQHLCGKKFRSTWLLDVKPTPVERDAVRSHVRHVLRWSGKRRFAAKLTGPPRIGFLREIFPRAVFLHLVRDGRAVARSLLRVAFWRESFRMHAPAWDEGFPAEYERLWHETGDSPLALAALQWRHAIEVARREAIALGPGQYCELRYEDFLAAPQQTLEELMRLTGLRPSRRPSDFLKQRFELLDMNRAFRAAAQPEDEQLLLALLGDTLADLGYASGADASAEKQPA